MYSYLCYYMLSVFIMHGFIMLSSLVMLSRYSDIRSYSIVFITNLFLEFFFSLLLMSFTSTTGLIFFFNIGSMYLSFLDSSYLIVFVYDNLSGYFHSILFIALSICLVFLFQYFEYDLYGTSIVLLSSLFSQLAFIYFCTYDVISLIFFWEWISIVSFLLVQHWLFRVSTVKAAIKVFIISQLGDLFFY